jgi:hypothetical protein
METLLVWTPTQRNEFSRAKKGHPSSHLMPLKNQTSITTPESGIDDFPLYRSLIQMRNRLA